MRTPELAQLWDDLGTPCLAETGDMSRLSLALKMADDEYHHPECEAAAAREDQRSFCFDHGRVTSNSILLIHGFTACPYEMRELGKRLYARGYNVFGTRLAGHGTSPRDFARYNGSHWEDSARKGLGITALLGEEVVVIGESMGGCLAALLAQKYPKLVSKLILCAPCFQIANPWAWITTWRWMRIIMPKVDMGVNLEWQYAYWYREIATSGVAELVKISRKARRVASEIITPVQIIQAKDDRVVRPQGAQKFYDKLERLPGTAKQLKLLEHGHHNLTIDINPGKEEVFKWITEFIGI